MYRLLIVDDEPEIINWLYELFEECECMELDIYKAYSGEEALKWLNIVKIDILLTDIHMPGMTGLKLVEQTHKNWPKCRIIFLTGFHEFDYVYTAIKHDSISYLLKTEEDEEIIHAVEKAVKDIQKELKIEETINRAKQQLSLAIPILRKEYLVELLQGVSTELTISQEKLDGLGISLKADSPVLLLIGQLDSELEAATVSQLSHLHYVVGLIFEQYLPAELKNVYVVMKETSLVWIIQPSGDLLEDSDNSSNESCWDKKGVLLQGTLEFVQLACKENFGITISFIMATEHFELNLVAEKFHLLRRQLNNGAISGKELILIEKRFMNYLPGEGGLLANSLVSQISSQLKKVEALETYMERGQKKEFYKLLSMLTDYLKNVKSMNYTPALQVFYTLSVMFLGYINNWDLVEKVAYKTGLNKLTRIESHESWNDAVEYLFNLAGYIFEIQESGQDKRTKDVIIKIKEYIGENLASDCSLVKLAEMVYFNPSYLSRFFKKTTGMNLSNYIDNARYEKAKELLKDSNLKIHEIGKLIGFESAHYFAHFFNKYAGISPREYRIKENSRYIPEES